MQYQLVISGATLAERIFTKPTMIVLHLCCGPCTIYPLNVLRRQGLPVQGYFYNPNIHPFREFQNRLQAVEMLARKCDFTVAYEQEYGLTEYLRRVVFHEQERCLTCYEMRLAATAAYARATGAEAFSTTLLYSRYQKHDLIREVAEAVAEKAEIPFYYSDFRVGWQEGVDLARELQLYRQTYCGCIYSEQERYDKKRRKRKAAGRKP